MNHSYPMIISTTKSPIMETLGFPLNATPVAPWAIIYAPGLGVCPAWSGCADLSGCAGFPVFSGFPDVLPCSGFFAGSLIPGMFACLSAIVRGLRGGSRSRAAKSRDTAAMLVKQRSKGAEQDSDVMLSLVEGRYLLIHVQQRIHGRLRRSNRVLHGEHHIVR